MIVSEHGLFWPTNGKLIRETSNVGKGKNTFSFCV